MYKVTLSMPVYNVEKYVERALLSALNQTFESIEYLIVDDKGTDNSMDVVRRIITNHPRGKDVRIIDHGVNQGTGATKNSAIKEAKGEYLYFMDSDDEITKDCIEILYNKMQENPVDFVAASISKKDTHGKIILEHKYKDYILNDNAKNVAHIYYLDKIDISITTWNKLYNINFLRDNEIYCLPKHLNEDVFFTFQVILNAKTCILMSIITYNYCFREGSVMNVKMKQKIDLRVFQYVEIINYQKQYLEKHKYKYPILYAYILTRTMYLAYFFSYQILKSDIDNKKKYIYHLLNYPINFYEIKLLNHKQLMNYYFYIIDKSPYYIKYMIILFCFYYKINKNNLKRFIQAKKLYYLCKAVFLLCIYLLISCIYHMQYHYFESIVFESIKGLGMFL
ncbi:putative glycosyltransferase EpsH [termite gut metagenome]|uniref:Putative glycosyltransferase EpsH n=1 Tax=termite gut metagenome TaxID=433724 RepID=A0A5J4S0J3_9ZZZZ